MLINTLDLNKMIELQLGDRYEAFANNEVKEEANLVEQYAKESIYNIDEDTMDALPEATVKELLESDTDGLEKRGFTLPSKEEESKLNPQVEEDESYNENDESMELIDEENTYVDSRGRLHDKRTGKFIKM